MAELPKVRQLTYDELDELWEKGLDPALSVGPEEDGKLTIRMAHYILKHFFKEEDFKGLPGGKALAFAVECYYRTVGNKADEKN